MLLLLLLLAVELIASKHTKGDIVGGRNRLAL